LPLTAREPRAVRTSLLANSEIVPGIFLASFEAPDLAAEALPGQFVMLSIPELKDPLLPRPFAVFDVKERIVEVLYRTVGKGTGLLSRMRKGDGLRVFGPLGNGFALPDPAVKAVAVAGGIGFASLHFLLVRLLARQQAATTLLYGVRSPEDLVPLESLERKRLAVRVATEDGRQGVKGRVTRLLSDPEELLPPARAELFVCGPLPMLRAVAERTKGLGVKGQYALESRMACGYGVCQGCVFPFRARDVPGEVRYRKVCTEGPVFDSEEICWEAVRE
jgi:dihydroorotate dehydrogenase electron transfer subunit